MDKGTIRLRYSGFVIFASRLLSGVTGSVFLLMVARGVTTKEFGIWGNISDVLGYFVLLSGILPFWTTRFVARKHVGSAKTGLLANILISTASASIYLALLSVVLSALHIAATYTILYVIASIQIVELYTISASEAILQAQQPQAIGYGLLIHAMCKVSLGFLLIVEFQLGLLGAICSIISSFTIQIAFYITLLAKDLKEGFRWTYLKEWLKASPANLYAIVGDQIAAFTLIFLFIYGELARSYYQAAFTIAGVISYSSFLAFALYPKLLSQISIEDVFTSLKMVLMSAIPMTVGAIVLSDSYLSVLDPIFTDARLILSILAISTLCACLSGVFNTVIMGTEKIDAQAKIPFKQLVKTRLFKIFTLPYVQSVMTIPTTFFVLFHVAKTPLEATTYLVLINLTVGLGMLLCRYVIARKCLIFSFPWKNIIKYIIASTVMAVPLLVVPHPTRLLPTMGLTFLGGGIYFAILAAIDQETRELIKSILSEIKSKLRIT